MGADDFGLILKFCAYLAQYTETNGYAGYYICTDNAANQPDLLYFENERVTVKKIISGATFTTCWQDECDSTTGHSL